MPKNYLVISNRKNVSNAAYFADPEALFNYLNEQNEIKVLIYAFWSWKVPDYILNTFKCYGLHTGPLLEGKGKGGSPIDNLKALGTKITTLCVFEMNDKIDEGRVVLAIPFRLQGDKTFLVYRIADQIPIIVEYLMQSSDQIPERFKRIENVK